MTVAHGIVIVVACLMGATAYHLTIRARGGMFLGTFLALLFYTLFHQYLPLLLGD